MEFQTKAPETEVQLKAKMVEISAVLCLEYYGRRDAISKRYPERLYVLLGRLYKVLCSASPPPLDVQDFIAVWTAQL